MKRVCSILTIGLLLFARAPARADDLLLDRFTSYLESLRIQAGIPGLSAAVVGGSDVLWSRGFGRADVERGIPARSDTLFHLDGVTQVFTASLVLRCVEEGRLSLEDRIGAILPGIRDGNATVRQLLTHTADGGVFSYQPERLEPLTAVITECSGDAFRQKLAKGFDYLAMFDSVPGPDVVQLNPEPGGIFEKRTLDRYSRVLGRLAVPYAVDQRNRSTPSQYLATTLRAAAGSIATVDDLTRFVAGLNSGLVMRPETLALAWRPAVDARGVRLPHGLGWFVQSYNGETIAWQFGVGDNASSSLLVTVPGRGVTMILLANSDGLARSFPLAAGDLTVSPFARLFLGLFVR